MTTSSNPASSPLLRRIRTWRRKAYLGQRVRLAAGPDGRLLVASSVRRAGSVWSIRLEDAGGAPLDERDIRVSQPQTHRLCIVDGRLLVRDGLQLLLGGVLVSGGEWEAYAGASGVVLGWEPSEPRPAPASLFHGGSVTGAWLGSAWVVELFGVDMAEAGAEVLMGSRENPQNNGWTLRRLDAAALRLGLPREVAPLERWKPRGKLSLEDPQIVRGASKPTLIGTAYDKAARRPSGRVFLAETGGPLREMLQAAPIDGNVECGAVVHSGRLFLAVETEDGKSALYGFTAGAGMELLATVPGGAPWLASAEGALWMSTAAGIWSGTGG